MRLDHIAYRVADRKKTAKFFQEAMQYKVQTEFEIKFDDGSTAKCIALEPPEKDGASTELDYNLPFAYGDLWSCTADFLEPALDFHMAPEIFVSDGDPESIVGKWVAARGGIGGIHHLAYQVDSVADKMAEWKEKGYAEFTTEEPMTYPGLTQCFTKPSELTGVIYEFIERGEHGFCQENVKQLMESTKDLS